MRALPTSHWRTETGCHGGVPPLGHDLPIHVDADLLRWDEVWAAAGTWTDVFPIAPDELVRVSGGTVCDIRRD